MTYKNDKIRDLTPLVTTFIPGESPTAAKLQGMMEQSDEAIAYIENKLGDLAGEEGVFSTWISTLARNVGDFSKLNPAILPAFEITNYTQNLVAGAVEHELDMIPIGELNNLIQSTADSCVVISQYKASEALLESPGDWTISYSYIENGNKKRGRKLVTHSPSEGGYVVFKKVTSGNGSSIEGSSENTIPSLAQAENDGPFVDISVVNSSSKIYLVTLPLRTKMYDQLGAVIDFTASNTKSAVGNNSQYQLPDFFFGTSGLDLDSNDSAGLAKAIPLNLIKLYDWNTKKEVEGIIYLEASPTEASRKYQFILQTEQDVILDTATGKYIVVVPGNSVISQLRGLINSVYNNTGVGADMTRLISHKNLMNLRTGSTNYTNRSAYYGPSNIENNDHSMYFHRNGFTDTDKGAGGNVIRGDVVIGSTTTGSSDSIHENFNVTSDSYSLHFGNIASGPNIKYAKSKTYSIDHSYGGLPLGLVDAGLWIEGAVSDINPTRKNIFLEGDIRTSGNIILGKVATDVIFLQGKTYLNDELTFIPRSSTGITPEEGKTIYSSDEKSLIFHNGSKWLSPWNLTGFTTVIGDGVNTFGKYNGMSYSVFTAAVAEVVAAGGGTIKILPGSYNVLANRIDVPVNVTVEGSGDSTVISGTGTVFKTTGANAVIRKLKVSTGSIGIQVDTDSCIIDSVTFNSNAVGLSITGNATNLKVLSNINYINCAKTTEYTGTSLIVTSEVVSKSAITYTRSVFDDWSNKDLLLKEFVTTIGAASVTYDPAISGAIGKGGFLITGDGTIVCKKLLPANINVGIGSYINMRRVGTTGTASVGVICYDASYNNLGTRNFILNATALGTDILENSFYKDIMIGTSGFTTFSFPSGTRFVQPFITVSSNVSGIQFDSFNVENLGFSRMSVWG